MQTIFSETIILEIEYIANFLLIFTLNLIKIFDFEIRINLL